MVCGEKSNHIESCSHREFWQRCACEMLTFSTMMLWRREAGIVRTTAPTNHGQGVVITEEAWWRPGRSNFDDSDTLTLSRPSHTLHSTPLDPTPYTHNGLHTRLLTPGYEADRYADPLKKPSATIDAHTPQQPYARQFSLAASPR
jgi:hypothetical protein